MDLLAYKVLVTNFLGTNYEPQGELWLMGKNTIKKNEVARCG